MTYPHHNRVPTGKLDGRDVPRLQLIAQMRQAGKTWKEVAAAIGYATPGAAWTLFHFNKSALQN